VTRPAGRAPGDREALDEGGDDVTQPMTMQIFSDYV
jgi:hypothetical protein